MPAAPDSSTWGWTIQIVLALLAGVAVAIQPGINMRLAGHAGSAMHGSVANFLIGLVALVSVTLLMRVNAPSVAGLSGGPWWMWTGGLCGAFFVTLAVVLVPRMGATNFLAAMLAGQFVASAVIDHYGWIGMPMHALGLGRVVGLLLIAGGVACVLRS